ncbi:hypothetical protein [Streptomyces sp. NPDC048142]|uniref:hypothetical protein n=1 Tax=Streptomyces sp. NPDC048142 TaxID=3365501 RepID=UPI00371493AC
MSGPGRRGRTATVTALAPAAGVPAPVAAAPPAAPLTGPVGLTAARPAGRGTTARPSRPRFALPAVPAGRFLEAARLRFRTSSQEPTGSTDRHDGAPDTGARTGSTVTHDSRPALAASVLGTNTGATAVSTGHSVELSAPAPGGALGSAYSLAPTGSGTDSPRLRSGEAGSAAYRPQLVLTFGAE